MRTDAIRLSQKEQALLRRQAIRMKERGTPTAQIAEVVAVHPKTVARWWTAYRRQGATILRPGRRGRRVGTKRVLTSDQEQTVCRLLQDKTPDQLKLPFALWTRQAVSDLLAQRYGVRLPVRTMGAYLHRWGFTPQKPRARAYEQSPAAVQRWLTDTYPTIARQAKGDKAEIFWGDQTGLTNQPHAPRGHAPRGQTPVVRQRAARFSLSMMSAVTNRGSVRFMCYPGALNAARCCTFLRRLVKSAGGRKVVLILDNLRVHHSTPVTTWLAAHPEQITVHYLPAYSPELNPDELLNRDLKETSRGNPRPGMPATWRGNAPAAPVDPETTCPHPAVLHDDPHRLRGMSHLFRCRINNYLDTTSGSAQIAPARFGRACRVHASLRFAMPARHTLHDSWGRADAIPWDAALRRTRGSGGGASCGSGNRPR